MVYFPRIICYCVYMYDTLKYVYIWFSVFSVWALIAFLPFDRWQKSYIDEFHRLKYEPQRRIEATYKYLEDVEDGKISIDDGVNFESYLEKITPKRTAVAKPDRPVKPYQKPLYVRDKYNPRILHPYHGK